MSWRGLKATLKRAWDGAIAGGLHADAGDVVDDEQEAEWAAQQRLFGQAGPGFLLHPVDQPASEPLPRAPATRSRSHADGEEFRDSVPKTRGGPQDKDGYGLLYWFGLGGRARGSAMAHRVRVARSAAAFDARLPDDKEAFIAAAPTAQASAKAAAAAEQAVYQARADQAAAEHPCVKHTGAGVQGRKGLRRVTVVSLQSVFTILLYLLHCPVCKQDFYVNPFSFGCSPASAVSPTVFFTFQALDFAHNSRLIGGLSLQGACACTCGDSG